MDEEKQLKKVKKVKKMDVSAEVRAGLYLEVIPDDPKKLEKLEAEGRKRDEIARKASPMNPVVGEAATAIDE